MGNFIINLFKNYGDDVAKAVKVAAPEVADNFKKVPVFADDALKSLKPSETKEIKNVFAEATKAVKTVGIHEEFGDILRMQKPGKIKIQSVPTQQYLDDMLNVATTERIAQVEKDGIGWVNKQAVSDALYGFTKGTKRTVEPVVTTSVPTAEVINGMHRIDYVDAMRMADATGEIPADVLARRREIVETFDNQVSDWGERFAVDTDKILKKLKINEQDLDKKIKEEVRKPNLSIDKLLALQEDFKKLCSKDIDKFMK